MVTASKSAQRRAKLKHPVIDIDGHFSEMMPIFKDYYLDYVKKVGGTDMLKRFEAAGDLTHSGRVVAKWYSQTPEERRDNWTTRPSWGGNPTKNPLDVATSFLPKLMHERMDDMGIDFMVLFPGSTISLVSLNDEELRRVGCRAVNSYHAEIYGPYADRMTPVAAIPMRTPEEAIDELEYAVKELGLKAALINGYERRPIPKVAREHPNLTRYSMRLDTYGLDSDYDYDPVWAKFVELGVAPSAHGGVMGIGVRRSISNYVYNHIGGFSVAGEAEAKSLFLSGVTRRFPKLHVGFMEGGVDWACKLYAELIGHWEKRNGKKMAEVNLAPVDVGALMESVAKYGDDRMKRNLPAIEEMFAGRSATMDHAIIDEFEPCQIERAEDIKDLFEPNFYYGCEADDPTLAWAFNDKLNPFGAKMRAMLGSDIGHWDVPDVTMVIEEAYENVEKEILSEDDFRDFVFGNAVRFYAGSNPDFFKGTPAESAAAAYLQAHGD
ncbi:amidohydrolase family protein [Dehalococcoidia bacterium]|nr:amidohydrolase family protein [Dehalococcoidia bacterium]